MKNNLKLAGLGLAATMALTVQSSAQAYDFSFDNFEAGIHSASGTFRINDSTPQGAITPADFEDWEITLVDGNGGANQTLFGPGGAFGTPNSVIGIGYPSNAVFDSNSLTFTTDLEVHEYDFLNSSRVSNGGRIATFNGGGRYTVRTNGLYQSDAGNGFLVANSTATPVPFGVSTDLSILILGGLYGASRLRKTIAARKQISNLEA